MILPSSIGRYRIVGKLGEGGMGIVYEAEQEEPRRRVAVKVVRGGEVLDDTRVRLFQREVEALARLKHPGIASIYDAGRTSDGQPFLAMELVRGVSLDEYLRARPMPTSRAEVEHRLRLFSALCDAVHYAHQRGVIHRDLKPSNVFLSDEHSSSSALGVALPAIKVLDFGLARITAGDALFTVSTDVGVIRGTLPYMSPEQARGSQDSIDVRTDVYSLGVILYEMLSGARPYEIGEAGIAEAIRAISEDPPPPLRGSRGSERRIDVDLETIVRKALEKEPDQRYASAAALADDVQRHLSSQPILARRPSALYQLRKFAGRNRLLVGGALASFLLIAAAAVVATLFGIAEARQRREVESARADLEQVVDFQDRMLAEIDPEAMGRRLFENLRRRVGDDALSEFDASVSSVNPTDVALDVLDGEILKRAVQTVDSRFADQPLIAARLLLTLADTYTALGRADQAEPLARRSLAIREQLLGAEDPQTVDSRETLGIAIFRRGRHEEAERAMQEVVDARRQALGPEHVDTLHAICVLASIQHKWGHHDEAIRLMEPVVEASRRVYGHGHPSTITAVRGLAAAYASEERFDLAEPLVRSALESNRNLPEPDQETTLSLMSSLGNVLWSTERLDEAEDLYLELIAAYHRAKGEDHVETLRAMEQLALVYAEQGLDEKALDVLEEVREAQSRVLGAEHEQTLSATHNVGVVMERLGRLEEAERIYLQVIEARERTLGPGNPRRLRTMRVLASLMANQSRLEEAEAVLLDALADARTTSLGEEGLEAYELARSVKSLYYRQGRFAEAMPYAQALVEYNQRVLGEDAEETLAQTADVGSIEMLLGRLDRAEEIYTRVLAAQEKAQGERSERALLTRYNLACLRVRQGRNEAAIALLQSAIDRGYEHQDILSDPDMDPLRGDPRFAAMIEEVQRRRSEP